MDVLEIWEPNIEALQKLNFFNKVIQGDVREIYKYVDQDYDVIFWWHGPEHIKKEELESTLNNIEDLATTMVVLGCPWGDYPQGALEKNPYEVHVSAYQPGDFRDLGYQVEWLPPEGRGGNILAWKEFTHD